MTHWLPFILGLVATGCLAGILAGLLGVGGGIVVVPVLFFMFQLLGISAATSMQVATGTSLMTIVLTSLSSMRAHHKRGNVDWDIVRTWSGFMLTAVIVGSALATRINGVYLSALFGVIAIIVSLNMAFRGEYVHYRDQLPGIGGQAIMAAVTGLISVMIGIGAASIGIPLMTSFNVRMQKAIGTAAVFGFVIALPGTLNLMLFGTTPPDAPLGTIGHVNLPGFALIVPLSVSMVHVGIRLGAKLNATALRRVFAVFLFLTGIRMIYQLYEVM
jgi:uncharacterized membrane protein YfcA